MLLSLERVATVSAFLTVGLWGGVFGHRLTRTAYARWQSFARARADADKLQFPRPNRRASHGADRSGGAARRIFAAQGQLKDRSKIERRLGKIQARHPQVADLYTMSLTEREGRLAINWKLLEERRAWREACEGAYRLRTNLEGESAEEL